MIIKTTMNIYEEHIKEILNKYEECISESIYTSKDSPNNIIVDIVFYENLDEINGLLYKLNEANEIDDVGEAGDISRQLNEAKFDAEMPIHEIKTALKEIQYKVNSPIDFLFIDDNFEL